MRLTSHDVLIRGALGGLLAGAIVSFWFMAADLAAGAIFRTPEALARILFELPEARSGWPLVVTYSVLHFGAFAFLGIVTTWLLAWLDVKPGLLVGMVLGIGVLNAVHYASLLVTGSDALTVLPWPHVMGANLLAGLGLMTYLHRTTCDPRPIGLGVLREHPLVVEAFVTGLIGAAAVALWFLALDVSVGRPLRTPAALGSAIFLGAEGPAEVQVGVGIAAAYTVAHVAAFWAAGAVLVGVARQVERLPSLAFMVLLAFIVLEAVSFGVLVSFAEWVVGDLSLWTIGVGNLLGVGAMGWWVWRTSPALRRSVLAERLGPAV